MLALPLWPLLGRQATGKRHRGSVPCSPGTRCKNVAVHSSKDNGSRRVDDSNGNGHGSTSSNGNGSGGRPANVRKDTTADNPSKNGLYAEGVHWESWDTVHTYDEADLMHTFAERTLQTDKVKESEEGDRENDVCLATEGQWTAGAARRQQRHRPQWPWLEDIAYKYYIRRTGTLDDLKLFAVVIVSILGLLAAGRASLGGVSGAWANAYSTYKLTFGEFDDVDQVPLQLFSILVATIGFMGFALILALTEQVFLEGLDGNVRVGSRVLEAGHTLFLAFGRSPRDQEMLVTLVRQMCSAYKDVGGTALVVMCETPKLEMEQLFRKAIPSTEMHGSWLVCRQGNPLVEPDLRMVNASASAATVIIGDQSRSAQEADAQSLRVAIMLDELDFPGFGVPDPRRGHVLVETFSMEVLELIQFSCSKRVIPVATSRLNARRLARMLRTPIVGITSRSLWSFMSDARVAIEAYPELEGARFEDVYFRFGNATPIGVISSARGQLIMCPPLEYVLRPGDELCLVRTTGSAHLQPLEKSLLERVEAASWSPCGADSSDELCEEVTEALEMGRPVRLNIRGPTDDNICGTPLSTTGMKLGKSGLYVLPEQYTGSNYHHYKVDPNQRPLHVLMVGWKADQFMVALLYELDRGHSKLPPGSHITFVNDHCYEDTLGRAEETLQLRHVTVNHERCNPLKRHHLDKLNMEAFDCAMVLADEKWLDPDENQANGYDDLTSRGDLLRLDSIVMLAQLNIRKALAQSSAPDINIICEKLAYGSTTRFEDLTKLPLGISVNFTSFSAKMLAFLAFYPKQYILYSALGELVEMSVFDSSWLCALNERLSFVQLAERAMQLRHIVIGYYELPLRSDEPLLLEVNPKGEQTRLQERIWNWGAYVTNHIGIDTGRLDSDELLDLPVDNASGNAGNGKVKILALSPRDHSVIVTPKSSFKRVESDANRSAAEIAYWML